MGDLWGPAAKAAAGASKIPNALRAKANRDIMMDLTSEVKTRDDDLEDLIPASNASLR